MPDVSHRDHVDAHDQATSKLSAQVQALKTMRQREDSLKAEIKNLKDEVATLNAQVAHFKEENKRLTQECSDWKVEHVRGKEALQKLLNELDALLGAG